MSFRQDTPSLLTAYNSHKKLPGTQQGKNQTGSGWRTNVTAAQEIPESSSKTMQSLYQTASIEAFNLSRSQEGFFRKSLSQ